MKSNVLPVSNYIVANQSSSRNNSFDLFLLVKPMETVLKKTIQYQIPTKPLLRRNKYYERAMDDTCAKCHQGKRGCCMPDLNFAKDDFKMDFTSEKQVAALLDIDIFRIRVDVQYPYVEISIREMQIGRYDHACLFWSKTGCRLAYDAKPKVCRVHKCARLWDKFEAFNKRDRNRTIGRKASAKKVRWHWSSEEVQTIKNVMGEHKMKYRRPDKITYTQAKALDWEYILTVLQGNTK